MFGARVLNEINPGLSSLSLNFSVFSQYSTHTCLIRDEVLRGLGKGKDFTENSRVLSPLISIYTLVPNKILGRGRWRKVWGSAPYTDGPKLTL
jgi:hypothetical protein